MGKCKSKKREVHKRNGDKGKGLNVSSVLVFLASVFELVNAFTESISHWGTLFLVIILSPVYLYAEYRLCKNGREDNEEYKRKDKELGDKRNGAKSEEELQQIDDEQEDLKAEHIQYQESVNKSRRLVRIIFCIGALIGLFVFVKGIITEKVEQRTEVMAKNESSAEKDKDGKRIVEKVTGENGETTDNTDQNGAGGTIENTIIVNGEKGEESGGEIPDIHFILDEPGRLKTLTDEMIKDVFYVSYVSPEKNGEEVSGHIDGIFGEKREDTSGNASIIEQGVIDEASKQEAIFKNDMQRAAECKSRNDEGGWQDYIPHSNDLENKIMNEREQFWNLEEPIFSSTLAFMMANSNQLLADEYKLQGGRPETVIFYWVESITWTERGLSYGNLFQEDKDEYYPYLKARYKDIYDFIEAHEDEPWAQEETYQEIKEKAYAIYLEM